MSTVEYYQRIKMIEDEDFKKYESNYFKFAVSINKSKYIKMIKNRYQSYFKIKS